MTASGSLSTDLEFDLLAKERDLVYEPELFPTAVIKTEDITFSCFKNGKIVITGIKRPSNVDDIVYPNWNCTPEKPKNEQNVRTVHGLPI